MATWQEQLSIYDVLLGNNEADGKLAMISQQNQATRKAIEAGLTKFEVTCKQLHGFQALVQDEVTKIKQVIELEVTKIQTIKETQMAAQISEIQTH